MERQLIAGMVIPVGDPSLALPSLRVQSNPAGQLVSEEYHAGVSKSVSLAGWHSEALVARTECMIGWVHMCTLFFVGLPSALQLLGS